jgi:hypothetical protein
MSFFCRSAIQDQMSFQSGLAPQLPGRAGPAWHRHQHPVRFVSVNTLSPPASLLTSFRPERGPTHAVLGCGW